MNDYQIKLFNELMQLTENNDAFYHQDFDLDGRTYRIFNYRLASYTNFLEPSALECRGHMFEVVGDLPVRLAALPMQKFFNLNENPMTMDLDLSKVDSVELKADGSLMSTYMQDGKVRLKSKGSLFSEQAIDAMKWLDQDGNHAVNALRSSLDALTSIGWTVNLEWCAPHNRIVIGYLEPHLTVLNVRDTMSGRYLSRKSVEEFFGKHVIDRVDTKGLDTVAFVQSIPAMQDDIEGYIARIGDLWFKIKTEKYMSLHHAKDSVNNPRRLFEAVVDEGIDDLRSMFATDPLAIKIIDEMQEKVTKLYNNMVNKIETYYEANKHLDRKSFAIKAQAEVEQLYFGQVMNKYVGKTVDYKAFMKSKYKELGFKDTSVDPV